MRKVMTVDGSSVPDAEMSGILSDYLALEQLRCFRRLLQVRCGVLGAVALVVAVLVRSLSVYTRWVPVGLLVAPPVWAWIVEQRLALRLASRVARAGRQKVVKSP